MGGAARLSHHTKITPNTSPDEDQTANPGVRPVGTGTIRESDEERRNSGCEKSRADVVDVSPRLGVLDRWQEPPDDEERDKTDGHVDEEDPVPAQGVGEDSADCRTQDRRQSEHGAEVARVLAPLSRRVEVRQHGEREREHGAAGEALQAAEQDELPHHLAETGEHGRDYEQAQCPDEDGPTAEQIGQLAVDRPADRGGQQVDRDAPRIEIVAFEIGDDLGQGDSDDCLVEGKHEQREERREEDFELGAWTEAEPGGCGSSPMRARWQQSWLFASTPYRPPTRLRKTASFRRRDFTRASLTARYSPLYQPNRTRRSGQVLSPFLPPRLRLGSGALVSGWTNFGARSPVPQPKAVGRAGRATTLGEQRARRRPVARFARAPGRRIRSA